MTQRNENQQSDAAFKQLKAILNKEIEEHKARKSRLKSELKQGRLDNISYQWKVIPLNKRIEELSSMQRDIFYQICEEYRKVDISAATIEKYIERM